MDPIAYVVRVSRELEDILARVYMAEGRGLHQKVDSVQHLLPPDLVRSIHWIATIRNKMVHEADFDLRFQKMDDFARTAERIKARLQQEPQPASPPRPTVPTAASHQTSGWGAGGLLGLLILLLLLLSLVPVACGFLFSGLI